MADLKVLKSKIHAINIACGEFNKFSDELEKAIVLLAQKQDRFENAIKEKSITLSKVEADIQSRKEWLTKHEKETMDFLSKEKDKLRLERIEIENQKKTIEQNLKIAEEQKRLAFLDREEAKKTKELLFEKSQKLQSIIQS